MSVLCGFRCRASRPEHDAEAQAVAAARIRFRVTLEFNHSRDEAVGAQKTSCCRTWEAGRDCGNRRAGRRGDGAWHSRARHSLHRDGLCARLRCCRDHADSGLCVRATPDRRSETPPARRIPPSDVQRSVIGLAQVTPGALHQPWLKSNAFTIRPPLPMACAYSSSAVGLAASGRPSAHGRGIKVAAPTTELRRCSTMSLTNGRFPAALSCRARCRPSLEPIVATRAGGHAVYSHSRYRAQNAVSARLSERPAERALNGVARRA